MGYFRSIATFVAVKRRVVLVTRRWQPWCVERRRLWLWKADFLQASKHRYLNWLVVSNIFYFHPYLGKISNLTNIFQMSWNHQLANPRDPITERQMMSKGCIITSEKPRYLASMKPFSEGDGDKFKTPLFFGIYCMSNFGGDGIHSLNPTVRPWTNPLAPEK